MMACLIIFNNFVYNLIVVVEMAAETKAAKAKNVSASAN